ncbi:hypothetical protein NHX12_012419 [Muraenolepis orangiensis]|uniref:SEFIR domain-containing protein n=1 Tax=Muraenolepis orangiensis TaxID=630683 RepID=A0A9Q0I402_9TELE|nr:hypothetical protein NHX12_012419 [Muraenolepis orangiensis]
MCLPGKSGAPLVMWWWWCVVVVAWTARRALAEERLRCESPSQEAHTWDSPLKFSSSTEDGQLCFSVNIWLRPEDPVPEFHLSVGPDSRSLNVTLRPGRQVRTMLCYRMNKELCKPDNSQFTIDPAKSLSVTLNVSYLLPCVCVQFYNISTLDKHSQMCLQFSLMNNHHIHCPFKADDNPTWEAQWLSLCGTQLLRENAEKPCVQVWRSEPAQLGRRILCPEYTHGRRGLFPVAVLVVGVALVLLVLLVFKVTKSRTAGWLSIHKPVLLVCSSGQPAHVSAVCALASILQGELCATVRMALWSQSSVRQSGAGAGGPSQEGSGVADLGPLPWLYGEWDAVQRAQGKVLVVWSPEAKKVFERTREQKTEPEKRRKHKGTCEGEERRGTTMDNLEEEEEEEEEDRRLKERTLKCGTEKAVLLEKDESAAAVCEGSSITDPVLRATLARLQGALRQPGRLHPVVLISLRGLNRHRDIPNELRAVPHYCLPGDFRGLIRELARAGWGDSGHGCWPRLLSKVTSLWLARRMSHRLKAWLP